MAIDAVGYGFASSGRVVIGDRFGFVDKNIRYSVRPRNVRMRRFLRSLFNPEPKTLSVEAQRGLAPKVENLYAITCLDPNFKRAHYFPLLPVNRNIVLLSVLYLETLTLNTCYNGKFPSLPLQKYTDLSRATMAS